MRFRKWFNGINIMLYGFASLAIICVLVVLIPHAGPVQDADNRLKDVSDIFSFGSMLFSAIALIVAALAYKAAVQRPILRLVFDPWLGDGEKLVLPMNENPGRVNVTKPLTTWKVWLHNDGGATARYPVVEIRFEGAFFSEDEFQGWKATRHIQPWGWCGFQWTPGNELVVHPGFPIELPYLPFAGKVIGGYADESEREYIILHVTIAADGFYQGPTKYNVTLKTD